MQGDKGELTVRRARRFRSGPRSATYSCWTSTHELAETLESVTGTGAHPVPKPFALRCYHASMYAQKFQVDVLIRGERRPCPLEWLDQFSMRNFTNSADFDDTLPLADGRLEASFRLTPERFAEGLSAWLTQRGKGEGQPVQVEVKVL